MPLDGTFRPNVLLQVKNGPIDFQPREPFSPLFGAMPQTPLMLELQITKEYLGFATHLVYLAPLFEEVLAADTHVERQRRPAVRDVLHGRRRRGQHRHRSQLVRRGVRVRQLARLRPARVEPVRSPPRRSPTSGCA